MNYNTKNLIPVIGHSIEWMNANLRQQPERRREAYNKLVNSRRTLRRIEATVGENPAVAVYGESQVGKSYMISSLLSVPGERFTIKDGHGKEFDFISEINPVTSNTEATGVVTRFSVNYNVVNPDYPVKIKLLSVADIILILCNTYYNDINDYKAFKEEELREFVEELSASLEGAKYLDNPILSEDEVFDMQDYFNLHLKARGRDVVGSDFLGLLSMVIRKIGPDRYGDVFCRLWGGNREITELFLSIMAGLKALNYSREVYVPIDAVLNKYGTLLDVECLKWLKESDRPTGGQYQLSTPVLFFRDGAQATAQMEKSLFSAMIAEVVFHIDGKYVDKKLEIPFRGNKEIISKEFLRDSDLLDFPGARARKDFQLANVRNNYNHMILRGKVAYLFEKYCEERLINILLVCHSHEQSSQPFMPRILSEWIGSYIGREPEERARLLQKSVVSPLFIIATKFNIDLAYNSQNPVVGNRLWDKRFMTVLYKEILGVDDNPWFNEWTSLEPFRNIYLLRDFYYSSNADGKCSFLFEGYPGPETKMIYPEHMEALQRSFVAHPFINKHFKDPEFSWEAAVSLNNDGTGLIIKNLIVAISNANAIRQTHFDEDYASALDTILKVIREHYHDDNDVDEVKKAIDKARTMHREMDRILAGRNFSFGHMLRELQIKEGFALNYYHDVKSSVQLVRKSSLNEYHLILGSCPGISKDKSFEENLEEMRQVYGFEDTRSVQEYYEGKGIDLKALFNGGYDKVKSNSLHLAEGIIAKWIDRLGTDAKMDVFRQAGFPEKVMFDFVDNLAALATQVDLARVIAREISPFVDSHTIDPKVVQVIADITAEKFNHFIINLGYHLMGEEKRKDILLKKEQLSLPIDLDVESEVTPNPAPDLAQLDQLFDAIRPSQVEEDDSRALARVAAQLMPSYRNYKRWEKLMYISFVAASNIPKYNIVANEQLKVILDDFHVAVQ